MIGNDKLNSGFYTKFMLTVNAVDMYVDTSCVCFTVQWKSQWCGEGVERTEGRGKLITNNIICKLDTCIHVLIVVLF